MNGKAVVQLFLLLFLLNVNIVNAIDVVPLLAASHRLVKGLKQELRGQNPLKRQDGQAVTNMLKRLITDCSSDAYLILDMPGLTSKDMKDKNAENWPFLTKYLSISSTVVGVPFVQEVIDLNHIKEYITTTCQAEVMHANIEDEGSIDYIDVRKKIIDIQFNALDQLPDRSRQIQLNDEFIRKIIRKLPSPHYTIILTSTVKQYMDPIPQVVIESEPRYYGIFNDIVDHPNRQQEIELNNPYRDVPPHWIENKNTNNRYLANKQKDVVKLLDYELWMKHEKLIMTIVIMIVTIVMVRVKKLFNYLLADTATLS